MPRMGRLPHRRHTRMTGLNASPRSSRMRDVLLLFSVVLFSLSVRGGRVTSVIAVIACLSLAGAVFARGDVEVGDDGWSERAWEARLMFCVVVLGLLGVAGWSPASIGPTSSDLERLPGVVWIIISVVVFVGGRTASRLFHWSIVVITLAVTLIVGLNHLSAVEHLGLDVYFLHVAAADAIADGLNPYTDAVEVPDGAPTAVESDVITGYVYPPVTAISYAIGHWVFSDPRFTSLIAWMAFLALIGITGIRGRTRRGLLVMVLMASIPGWPLVLRAAWTEPLGLALLGAAFSLWNAATKSGLLVGLALASKQYFAVTAPLLLLHRDKGSLVRSVLTGIVIVATIGVAIIWGPSAFWTAAVEFHTSTPARPDSVNLVGLGALFNLSWDPPTILPLTVGLLVAVVTGLRSHTRRRFMLALGLTLSSSFLVSSQAFANYWFLVAGVCGLALGDVPIASSEESDASVTAQGA